LVLNEVLAKTKFGNEAATSPDAKKMLEPDPKYYVIWIAGMPGYARPQGDALATMIKASTLGTKEKSIPAADIQFAGQGRQIDFYFLFPRDKAFTADDKEVEFATKSGKTNIKAHFKLKDMEVDGKLGL